MGLMVWKVVPQYNLIYFKGSIPGAKGCEVRIRDSLTIKQDQVRRKSPRVPLDHATPRCVAGSRRWPYAGLDHPPNHRHTSGA